MLVFIVSVETHRGTSGLFEGSDLVLGLRLDWICSGLMKTSCQRVPVKTEVLTCVLLGVEPLAFISCLVNIGQKKTFLLQSDFSLKQSQKQKPDQLSV